jgi:hypothetical protein
MANLDISAALNDYKAFLLQAQQQYEQTIARAHKQLEELVIATSTERAKPTVQPQSAWIDGNDGERFLLLNEPAADAINDLLDQLKEVVTEMAKAPKPRK